MARKNITDRQLRDLEKNLLRSWADRTLRAINELKSLYEVSEHSQVRSNILPYEQQIFISWDGRSSKVFSHIVKR